MANQYVIQERDNQGKWRDLDTKIPAEFDDISSAIKATAALTCSPESPYFQRVLRMAPKSKTQGKKA